MRHSIKLNENSGLFEIFNQYGTCLGIATDCELEYWGLIQKLKEILEDQSGDLDFVKWRANKVLNGE